MASIDERVVAMSFENAKFESGVKTTMGTLGKLDSSIRNIGQASGLNNIQSAADKLNFNGLHRSIDGISNHFSAMSVAVGVIIGGLATTVIQKLGSIGKSLALDPITQGFQEYATNLNSIQTILANTQDSGGNLKTVNAALQDLNRYSDKTIYNFGQMAKNIGTFTAAGVQLKPATESIKGIANLAALSGSNADQASSAMYQLSQAIASGKVNLQDWNSVVNAGMGGAVFQKALLRTGQAMGTIAKGAIEIDKKTGHATVNGESFRESLQVKPGEKSWLTSDVLVKTLGQFTGDLTDAQLAAQGFNAEQIAAIQKTAKTAKLAATEVKTLSGVFEVVKESIGSGWSSTFQLIFGNFNESKKTFTDLSNYLQRFVSRTFNAFDGVLKQWKKLGGRTVLIRGIKIAFDDILRVLRPLHNAFRDIFPSQSGKDLFEMTKNFTKLMNALKPGDATIKDLRRIFRGFFAVLHIGFGIIKGVGKLFEDLFKAVGAGSGGFLDFGANVGDFLVQLDKALTKGGLLNKFFQNLEKYLKKPLKLLQELAGVIGGLFGDAASGASDGVSAFTSAIGLLNKVLIPVKATLDLTVKAWDAFLGIVGKVKDALSPLLTEIAHVIANFGKIVADAIKSTNYDTVFAAINTVLLGGIFLAIKKVLSGGFGIKGGLGIDIGGGFLKNLNNMFQTLTGNLTAMQRNVQAKTLLAIASALAVLAVAILLLSTVNPKKLAAAMTALAVGMGELVGAMALLNKAAGGSAFVRMPFIAGSLILLAGAMVLLAVAAKIFATMSWSDIERGLAAVAGMLAAVGAATQLTNPVKMLATGLALIPIATGLILLAGAAKLFALMSWKDIGKGLGVIAGMLAAIGLAMQLFPTSAILMGPSLILIAIAIGMLAGSILAFGHMDTKTLAKGILAIAAALVVIGLAMDTIPLTLVVQAVGLAILAGALASLAGVIAIFGNMQVKTLVRGIIAMGAALLVLAVGLTAMEGTLGGSLALTAAAWAFAILAPALDMMGHMSWSTIIRGLVAMAAVIGVLALLGVVAGPALIVLGIGLAAVGGGLLAIGASVYLAAKGLSLLSDTAVKSVAALLAAAAVFIAALPEMVINFVKGIVSILDQLVKLSPKIIAALINITTQLLNALVKLVPAAAKIILLLIGGLLLVLKDQAGPFIAAGFDLLMKFLSGLADNAKPIAEKVATVIGNILAGLAGGLSAIVTAGLNLINGFLSGIIGGIPRLAATVARLIVTFVENVAKHIPSILAAAGTLIANFITGLASQLPKIISAGISIVLNLIEGIRQNVPKIVGKAVEIATTFVTTLANGLLKLVKVGADTLINFMNGLADAIREKEPKLFKAGINIASAIGEGMLDGLKQIAPHLIRKVGDIAGSMIDKATSVFDIGSPSRVFQDIGKNVMQGLTSGINNNAGATNTAMANAAKGVVATGKKHFGKAKLMDINTKPVIKPVLDLSMVRKQAPELQKILNNQAHVTVGVTSTKTASNIAKNQNKTDHARGGDATATPTTVNFTQNNNSPEPLSNIEIYRQTNNQLSRIRNSIIMKTPVTPHG